MRGFAARREARFASFHARAQATSADEVSQPAPESGNKQSSKSSSDDLERINAEIDRVNNQLDGLRGDYEQASQQAQQLFQQLAKHEQVVREFEAEKNSRGFFGRLRHGKNDQSVLDEAINMREKVSEYYDQAVDYLGSFTALISQFEAELDKLTIQRDKIDGLKQSMEFLESIGIDPTANAAMGTRIHQQAAADSAYDNDQDNWLDNTPEFEGPEL